MVILAIDPGEVHVGWALGGKVRGSEIEWAVSVGEWTYDETPFKVQDMIGELDEVVVEEYVLYADKAGMQTWGRMATSELIGMIRMVAGQHEVKVIMQGAYIKKATVAQLKARGIDTSVLRGKGGHAKDALTHLWYRILKEGY